jgi:hypothetical protein
MKKLGLIGVSLVTVLATLGIGFSMWSQTVTINGQVNTGNVKLTVSNPTGTWAYKDESIMDTNGMDSEVWVWGYQQVNNTGNPVLPPAPDLGHIIYAATWPGTNPVNWSDNIVNFGWTGVTAFGTDGNGNPTVTIDTYNLFPVVAFSNSVPFATWDADFDVTNSGSVPVKLIISPSGGLGSIDGMSVQIGYNNGGDDMYTDNIYDLSQLQGMQLDPGQHVHMLVGFTPNEGTTQGVVNDTFSFTIQGVQWNEYTTAGRG